MTTAYGFLGQVKPAAGILTALYTVPASKACTGRITAANRSTGSTTLRVSIAVNGAADSEEQYVAWDQPLPGYESLTSLPIVLNAGDVVRVRSASGNVAFGMTGIEIDA